MSTLIVLDRLQLLDGLTLDSGSHRDFETGHCINEVAAWLAGEPHTDRPSCVSPVLRSYTMRLNDRWNNEDRQLLKPYAAKIVGTAGDGQDGARLALAQTALTIDLLPPWLRLAGLDDAATEIKGLKDAGSVELRQAIRRASDAAWTKRSQAGARLRDRIKAELVKQGRPAAAAVAVANADAAADAVAAADAAEVDVWGTSYQAARKFWDDWFKTNPSPVAQQVRDLAAVQRRQALALLDAMINPSAVA